MKHHLGMEGNMKRYLFLGVLIFVIAIGVSPAWSSGKPKKDPGDQPTEFVNHRAHKGAGQVLGGNSSNASNGLSRAKTRATSMQDPDSNEQPKEEPQEVERKKRK
jgi:hypothetical protein